MTTLLKADRDATPTKIRVPSAIERSFKGTQEMAPPVRIASRVPCRRRRNQVGVRAGVEDAPGQGREEDQEEDHDTKYGGKYVN